MLVLTVALLAQDLHVPPISISRPTELAHRLGAPDPGFREKIETDLLRHGEASIAPLEEVAREDKLPEARERAKRILAELRKRLAALDAYRRGGKLPPSPEDWAEELLQREVLTTTDAAVRRSGLDVLARLHKMTAENAWARAALMRTVIDIDLPEGSTVRDLAATLEKQTGLAVTYAKEVDPDRVPPFCARIRQISPNSGLTLVLNPHGLAFQISGKGIRIVGPCRLKLEDPHSSR